MTSISCIKVVSDISQNVEVDDKGNAEVFYTTYQSYGECSDSLISFSLDELEQIIKTAKAHQKAYQSYINRDYEDEHQYELDFQQHMTD